MVLSGDTAALNAHLIRLARNCDVLAHEVMDGSLEVPRPGGGAVRALCRSTSTPSAASRPAMCAPSDSRATSRWRSPAWARATRFPGNGHPASTHSAMVQSRTTGPPRGSSHRHVIVSRHGTADRTATYQKSGGAGVCQPEVCCCVAMAHSVHGGGAPAARAGERDRDPSHSRQRPGGRRPPRSWTRTAFAGSLRTVLGRLALTYLADCPHRLRCSRRRAATARPGAVHGGAGRRHGRGPRRPDRAGCAPWSSCPVAATRRAA